MKESSQKQAECALSPDKLKTMLNKMRPSERLDAPLLGDELIPALPSEIKSEHESCKASHQSCKASSEEKELAKLSCLNDSETQERGLWEVKIEKNFPLGHAPEPRKSLGLRRSFRKSVSINPRSAPASRFCSCFIIRKLKQRRF